MSATGSTTLQSGFIRVTDASDNKVTLTDGMISIQTALDAPRIPTELYHVATKKFVDDEITAVEATISGIETRLQTAETELASVTLPDDLVELTTDVTALEGRVDAAETDLTALETRIQTAESELADGDVATITSNISNIQTDVTAVQNDLATLEGRVDGHDTDISGIETRLATVETATGGSDLSQVNARLDDIETDISTIQSDATTLAGRVTTAENNINTQATSITNLQSTDTSHGTRLTNLESIDVGYGNRLNVLETSSTSYNSRIGSLETSDSSQNTRLTSAESNITAAQSDITSLSGRVDTAEADIDALESRQADFSDFTIDKTAKTLELSGYNITLAEITLEGNAIGQGGGNSGYLVPSGGSDGQVLAKASDTDGDFEYITIPSGGAGGTTQTINTINNSSAMFIGPAAISSGTDIGSSTLGAGVYEVRSLGWLSGSSGVVVLDVLALFGFNSNNRNFIGTLEVYARSTSTNKTASRMVVISYRGGQSSVSYTDISTWNNGASTWSLANQGSTSNLRFSMDTDMSLAYIFRGAM